MTNPKVSVVIPVYNGAEFISGTIESVINQSYPAHEIIVIDDGSTDGTPRVLEGFKGRIMARRIEKTGSPSIPRNTGMDMATGGYIAFLDADDLWFRHKLKKQIEYAVKYPGAGFFCCDFIERHVGQKARLKKHFNSLRHLDKINFNAPLKTDPFRLLLKENFVGGASTALIKKEVIKRIGGFRGGTMFGEDYEYWLRCAVSSDFVVLSDTLMYKRMHQGNLMRDTIVVHARHESALKRIRENMGPYIRKNGLSGECDIALAKSAYKLGSSYFESGRRRDAFGKYWEGLMSHGSLGNFIQFMWEVFKKCIRLLTFNIISRKNLSGR